MHNVGRQTPTYSWCASYTRSEGRLASALADAYGLSPHPWQRTILDDWLALDDGGHLPNSLCVLPVSRQNGKTGIIEPRETWGLVHRGEWILHTAHEYQTALVGFDRLRAKFGARKNDPHAKYPELNALVKKYTTSANQMVLDLKNGGHIEFRTRGNNDDVGRGGTFDLVVVDEAQAYTDEQEKIKLLEQFNCGRSLLDIPPSHPLDSFCNLKIRIVESCYINSVYSTVNAAVLSVCSSCCTCLGSNVACYSGTCSGSVAGNCTALITTCEREDSSCCQHTGEDCLEFSHGVPP